MSANFFDEVYARAEGNHAEVPWHSAISRDWIGHWFDSYRPADHRRALVVAAGLGDDAAALAEHGLDVVAFDYSPTAVDWARSRHPDAAVDWQVADLFAPPADWLGSFDLVVEVFTIQSIEPARQAEAAAAIRSFVAPGGTLVAVALVDESHRELQGPPWPIRPSTLDALADGLTETHRRTEAMGDDVSCVLTELTRPAA